MTMRPASILRSVAVLVTTGAAVLAIRSLGNLSGAGTDLDTFVVQVALRLAPVALALGTLTLLAFSRPAGLTQPVRRSSRLSAKPTETELRTAPAGSAV